MLTVWCTCTCNIVWQLYFRKHNKIKFKIKITNKKPPNGLWLNQRQSYFSCMSSPMMVRGWWLCFTESPRDPGFSILWV